MLTKFAVTNYRGFANRIEWNLISHSNYDYNQYAIKDGIIKNGIIFGPNGSGKTNMGLAVFDIVNHLTQKFKKSDYYKNFVYTGNPDTLVEFEYTFNLNHQILQYNYAKAKNGKLINESLSVDDVLVFEHKGKKLEIDNKSFPMEPKFKDELANNANNVSVVNVLLTSFPLSETHYLIKLRDFVNGMLWFRNVDIREFIGLETIVYTLDEYIIKRNLVDDFKTFLKTVSGQEFKFVKPQKNDKVLFCEYKGKTIGFDVIASTGTHALMLLYFWIQKMRNASLVFIDEFDAFYHFRLSFEVCKRLFKMDCQVFTSSHNTFLMTNELLRPDCNFILNGNKIKPLCDCTDKELREGHNIEKLFRANVFNIE